MLLFITETSQKKKKIFVFQLSPIYSPATGADLSELRSDDMAEEFSVRSIHSLNFFCLLVFSRSFPSNTEIKSVVTHDDESLDLRLTLSKFCFPIIL